MLERCLFYHVPTVTTRPYQLSEIECDGFRLLGYSVAGEESVILSPELDVAFDIGKCPREALRINHVLLTHGHMDHAAGVAYYFSQRDFQGIAGGACLVAAELVEPLERLMEAVAGVEGHASPHKFIPLADGQDYEVRRGLVARAFATRHLGHSLGFAIIDVRQKLKEEFAGKTGPELVELKKQGVEITRRVEIPLVAYLGDTAKADYNKLDCVRQAKVLLIECTFFDPDHVKRARAGRHLHVIDLPEMLEASQSERIVITHVTRRTNLAEARKILRKALPGPVMQRVGFLMSAKNLPPEDPPSPKQPL
jgi:ribonuclease Z